MMYICTAASKTLDLCLNHVCYFI